ncbi:hypothetical protein [Streptomyces gibsoniae]|uniref:Uncharacterized protein n=1 Tax=Streptomyces gibsoniae TaxID=3075529 RepID=A0ABU2TQQ0_9ACTN|nr:hypothetical protein [Streptomyces sp. DSM 41699]MDT0463212.1 hypothetical protein [Streptomyces sp. DSM 41699]
MQGVDVRRLLVGGRESISLALPELIPSAISCADAPSAIAPPKRCVMSWLIFIE